jgi:hypothetical protein
MECVFAIDSFGVKIDIIGTFTPFMLMLALAT